MAITMTTHAISITPKTITEPASAAVITMAASSVPQRVAVVMRFMRTQIMIAWEVSDTLFQGTFHSLGRSCLPWMVKKFYFLLMKDTSAILEDVLIEDTVYMYLFCIHSFYSWFNTIVLVVLLVYTSNYSIYSYSILHFDYFIIWRYFVV